MIAEPKNAEAKSVSESESEKPKETEKEAANQTKDVIERKNRRRALLASWEAEIHRR